MKYDFTSIIDRHGRDSIAVDGLKGDGFSPAPPKEGFDAIPMWVADMNFPTVPTIQQAIIERASHPTFGYFEAPPEYYKAIIRWQETRHGVTGLKPRHIGYENGVLGGVISALNCVCSRGDNVLIHSPTYIGFTKSLKNNGYEAVHSPLIKDENGIWRMDYADMEKQLREKKIHAAILCNPHNPCGRVWERRELEKAMELYRKYDVYVISDEIWSDLILNGHKHIPSQSVSEDARQRTAAFYAPSKTFNLAGCQNSIVVIPDETLRAQWDAFTTSIRVTDGNPFGYIAARAAYTGGRPWLNEVNEIVHNNYIYVKETFAKELPNIVVSPLEGTYLLWIDFESYLSKDALKDFMQKKCHLAFDYGDWFGGERFGTHIRMNLATSKENVEKAVKAIVENLK